MTELIFVYNAGSSKWQLALDIAHKVISPSTYPCKLCDLTYGILKIRPQWQAFLSDLDTPVQFLHADEFHEAFPEWKSLPLPTILVRKGEEIEIGINQTAFSQIENIERLVVEVKALLQKQNEPKMDN